MNEEKFHHLETHFNKLKSMISDMIENVRKALVNAVHSFEEKDIEMARAVINNDYVIDNLQRKIEKEIVSYIGRFQPLAEDLRYAITMIKLVTDLERIGDLASDIAEITIKYNHNYELESQEKLKKMTAIVENMVEDALTAYYKRDIELAIEVWKRDDVVDNLYDNVKDQAIKILKMTDSEYKEEHIFDQIIVARYLERAADHATNLAEEVYYIVLGKNLKEEMES
ncbi:MAG: phosphate signaling complex protein PhoU [Asgard group archaeon]|nr:phosphate signaling complex protein PhoU [Asgard group archaeon]